MCWDGNEIEEIERRDEKNGVKYYSLNVLKIYNWLMNFFKRK